MSLPVQTMRYVYNAYDQTYKVWQGEDGGEGWTFVDEPARTIHVKITHCGASDEDLGALIRAEGNYAAAHALEEILYGKKVRDLAETFDNQIVRLERNRQIIEHAHWIEKLNPGDADAHEKLLDCLKAHAGRTCVASGPLRP